MKLTLQNNENCPQENMEEVDTIIEAANIEEPEPEVNIEEF